ncbi:MAG: glucosaminidase domain-containing protein [Patulibacter sp.]|nr:glucosaminidase domain-containing protein [Patulibacter sp.]
MMLLRHATAPLATCAILAVGAIAVPSAAHASTGGAAPSTVTAPTTTTEASSKPTTSRATSSKSSSTGYIRLKSGSGLKVRRTPGRASYVGTVRRNQAIRIICQVNAGVASGKYGHSRIWNRIKLSNGRTGYVADASVEVVKTALVAPYCGWPNPGKPEGDNPQQGRCSSTATVPLVDGPADRAAFVKAAGPLARASSARTGVPASVTLAQAILESASGTLTAGANNYFGIKARVVDEDDGIFRWESTAVGCVHKPTYESEGKRLVRQIGQFRMYRGMQESFYDHGMFLRENSRYAPAFKHSDDPANFARAIAKAGYATDPSYANLLIRLITNKSLPLTPYDR